MKSLLRFIKESEDKGDINVCPVCQGPKTGQCRCPIGERWCAKGHSWYRNGKGDIVVGSAHGKGGSNG